MVLQSSGNISLLDIKGEFGGKAQPELTDYYRGGAYVPNTAANSGIPTSGNISITDFYGGDASSLTVDISPVSPSGSCSAFSPASCTAQALATANITGSVGSVTYQWEYVSGESFVITNATSATATFSLNAQVGTPAIKDGTYRCTVTDDNGSVSDTAVVTLTFSDLS